MKRACIVPPPQSDFFFSIGATSGGWVKTKTEATGRSPRVLIWYTETTNVTRSRGNVEIVMIRTGSRKILITHAS